ncbi:MAG: TIGR00730 family Rossman fold protein [Gammaproteobacteria bacterium]|nr:TIGR00730 family Rossman fold protein [Gammaproteobacteria bacterium]
MVDDLKGDESWRMFRIISEFTEGFDKLANIGFCISIFGSAQTRPGSKYYEATCSLSARLGKEGYTIITGGGPGIMEAANKGASESGATSVGLNIELPREQIANPYQNLKLDFRYFFARKVMFIKYSMGYVCMPGGFGTLDEFFEALTLMQTSKIYPMPLILFGTEYWGGLIDWIKSTLLANGAINVKDLELVVVTDDEDEVVKVINAHREWKLKKIAEEKKSDDDRRCL